MAIYFYQALNTRKALQLIEYCDALLNKKIKSAAAKQIACIPLAS